MLRFITRARPVQFILNRVWYVHPPVSVIIGAPPAACLQTLATAAKPSTQRLHLRNLFAGGRRYHLEPARRGFRLTTTSKVLWRYRRRTSSSAVVHGRFEEIDGATTRIWLHGRIQVLYLLDVFLIPAFMTSILLFTRWSPTLVGGLLATLYGLSWFGHRYNASLEAHEMVYFVQTALDDLAPAQVHTLGSNTPGVVYGDPDFEEQWEKFYEEHVGE